MTEEKVSTAAAALTLSEKINLLEKQLDIHLTIHDLRGILSLDMRDHILPGRRWHRCPYCWEGRFENDFWSVSCTNDCMKLPHLRSQRDPSPYWKKCWKGVWELVVPIFRNGQIMLLLYAGVFRDEKPSLPPEVKALPEFHRQYYRSLPLKKSVDTVQMITMLEFFGSALLLDPDKAYKVMESVKRNTLLPCTIKTRLGFDDEHMTAIDLCRAAESLNFAWVGIHGRTRAQQYSGTANYQAIGELKAQLKIPVLANGDVFTPEDAVRIQRETGADGIMIGRGCMGNPWLFKTARQALEGKPVEKETLLDRIETALLQAQWMVDFKGERLGIVEMRKHVGHYISGLRGATAIRRQVNFMLTLDEMRDLLETMRQAALQEEEA